MSYRPVSRVIAILLAFTASLVIAEQPNVDRGPADLIIENAKIFLPGTNHVALAIKANRVLAVGTKTSSRFLFTKYIRPKSKPRSSTAKLFTN